jgi:hypothetical protein
VYEQEPAAERLSSKPTSSKPGGSGLGNSAHPHAPASGELPGRSMSLDREATEKACGVPVAMLLGHSWAPRPSIGSRVNMGTIPMVPPPTGAGPSARSSRSSARIAWIDGDAARATTWAMVRCWPCRSPPRATSSGRRGLAEGGGQDSDGASGSRPDQRGTSSAPRRQKSISECAVPSLAFGRRGERATGIHLSIGSTSDADDCETRWPTRASRSSRLRNPRPP